MKKYNIYSNNNKVSQLIEAEGMKIEEEIFTFYIWDDELEGLTPIAWFPIRNFYIKLEL